MRQRAPATDVVQPSIEDVVATLVGSRRDTIVGAVLRDVRGQPTEERGVDQRARAPS